MSEWPVDHRTHLSGECWRSHHDCAVAEVERLTNEYYSKSLALKQSEAENERLREEIAEHLLRADSLRAELRRCQAENEQLEGELMDLRRG